MKQLITKLYKNQSFVYKIFLYILTTILVVYLFPKGGKFQYEFQKGKPWQYETLIAQFDFPITKTKEEIDIEKAEISSNAKTYYDYNTEIVAQVENDFDEQFKRIFSVDSIIDSYSASRLKSKTSKLLSSFYQNGVIATTDESKADQLVVLVQDNVERNVNYNKFIKLNNLQNYIKDFVTKEKLENYETQLYNLFFEIIEPNVTLDQQFTSEALTQELSTIAYTRGNIQEGIRIIAKGEVVEGEKYAILNSLKKEKVFV